MRFLLTDAYDEKKEITVKSWNGVGYGPDCFDDLEINFPASHKKEEEGETILCTSREYENLKAWWTEEINAMNTGTQAHDVDYSECPDDNITIFAD